MKPTPEQVRSWLDASGYVDRAGLGERVHELLNLAYAAGLVTANENGGFVAFGDYLALLAERNALRAEVERLTAEHKLEHDLLDEIGKLLEPVKYEGSYAAGVQVLLAENVRLEADAARYRWLRDNGGRGSNRVPHVTQYPFSRQLNEQEHPHFLVVGLDSAINAAMNTGGQQDSCAGVSQDTLPPPFDAARGEG